MQQWYQPRISRAESIGIRARIGVQSLPFVGLISTLVLIIWLISFGVGLAVLVYAEFKHTSELDYIGPAGFPLILLGAMCIRFIFYLFLECQFLFEVVGERQYHRWANSFNRDDPTKAAKVEDSRPLSYQYRPWWVAAVVVLGAVGLIVVGAKVRGMLWTIVLGAALLFETVLRLGLELLWVRTRFGAIAKPLMLRWMPWLSIPVRQY